MSALQTGSFLRYVLEQTYAKAWQDGLPPFSLRVYSLCIRGARLAKCWSHYAFQFLADREPAINLVAYSHQCATALATCAPEHLEDMDCGKPRAAIQYLIQHPPTPKVPFRRNWRVRASSIFSPRLQQLQEKLKEFSSVFWCCHQVFQQHPAQHLFYVPHVTNDSAFRRTGAAPEVQWSYEVVMEWVLHQLDDPIVVHNTILRNQVEAVRQAALDAHHALFELGRAVEVFIYLEWRALARWYTQSVVRRTLGHISHQAYIDSNLSVPEGVMLQVASFLVAGPYVSRWSLAAPDPIDTDVNHKRQRQQ